MNDRTFHFDTQLGRLKLTVPEEKAEENKQALVTLGFDPQEEA